MDLLPLYHILPWIGKVEDTENIYKYKMQLKGEEKVIGEETEEKTEEATTAGLSPGKLSFDQSEAQDKEVPPPPGSDKLDSGGEVAQEKGIEQETTETGQEVGSEVKEQSREVQNS